MAKLVNKQLLDERLGELEQARTWSPRLVSRLEAMLREADDAALFRINPLAFASERGLDEAEVVDLFLHASALGLFEMDWLLICPRCACAVESFAGLRAVLRRFRCPECRNESEAAMDDFIAIYFNVSPRILATRYHDPEALEPFDYIYGFKGVREGRTATGEPFVERTRRKLRAATFLAPGSTTRLEIVAEAGALEGFSSDTAANFMLEVEGQPEAHAQHLLLTFDGADFEPAWARLAPGPVVLEIVNAADTRGVLAVLQVGPDEADEFLAFEPYLTGKHLLTSQTFRSLFRSEVVGGAQGIAIRDIAFLFTDIRGSTALYQRIGDLNAFQLVQQHFDLLRAITVRHHGTVVKTIGDAVMAAYPDTLRAVRAAVEMRDAIEHFNESQGERAVYLKIGVHHGAAIAVTLNDALDYFGHAVNVASRIQEMADAEEIWITEDVFDYPGVAALLEAYPVEQRQAEFRGIERPVRVFRIGSRQRHLEVEVKSALAAPTG